MIERGDDLIATLMNQWTFQAMIHEVLQNPKDHDGGLRNNRVKFEPTARELVGPRGKADSMTFNVHTSKFYQEHQFTFWADVLQSLEGKVQKWKQTSSEMRQAVETRERSMSDVRRLCLARIMILCWQ